MDINGEMLETVLWDPDKGIIVKDMHYLHGTGYGAQRTSEVGLCCLDLHV